MTSLRIPITNLHAEGGYTARLFLGEQRHPVNLILDTGSSALVVHDKTYSPFTDGHLKATALVQDVQYGKGGWYGPVVQTSIKLGLHDHYKELADVFVALTSQEQSQSFFEAEGILGLAYTDLDAAYDLTEFLTTEGVEPCETFPYVMQHTALDVSQYTHFLHQYPRRHIAPYFTQLEEIGTVANQFALLTHRSSIYRTNAVSGLAAEKAHYLNQGLFVVGEPLQHLDLYKKPVQTVKVLHDKYYNVNVISISVGYNAPIPAPQLAQADISAYCTNGIVDSGASFIVLPEALMSQIKAGLTAHNRDFAPILAPFGVYTGKEDGVARDKLNLVDWPNIYLTLEGENHNTTTLIVGPENYWQTHAPAPDQATFKLCSLPGWPNQMILGLPLLNNYYAIFDRSGFDNGTIHFATKVELPAHVRSPIQIAVQNEYT